MSGTVTCASCGKSYRARPELAGKKVRCNCGGTMRMPTATVEEEIGAYELAEDVDAPKAKQPAADAAICIQCGHNFKTGQALTTATGATIPHEADEELFAAAFAGKADD